ncbi:MAG TPA: acyl-CoA desaturase [Sporichthya sp.]|nr:acyl-CoA desaturase [Sporichthya sp.]
MTDAVLDAPTRTGSDFAPLLEKVRGCGLLRLRRRRYAVMITFDLLALAGVWAIIQVVGNTWWSLFLALPLAIFTVRMIFVAHDVGHRQVARTSRVNKVAGYVVGDVILGLSARWWIDKHSRHHANPNEVGRDPDVGVGALSWTTDQAMGRNRVLTWLGRHQGRLFFPLLMLEAFNLHVGSVRVARTARELAMLAAHVAAYLGLLLWAMGPGKAAVFILVHQALIGLHLGCAFAPGHKGMVMPPPGSRWDFLRKQVLTTRNVRGGPATDWFLGGLNYQIEHHLFPGMPRPNLRATQPLVRAHCAELGLPYTEEPLVTSFGITIRHLQSVGRSAA